MALSADGYKTKAGAQDGFDLVKQGVKSAKVVDKTAK